MTPLDGHKQPEADAEESGTFGPALAQMIGVDNLKQATRLAGLSGGVLLILVALVAQLGSAETHLGGTWMVWATVPALIAAFGGPVVGGKLLSRRTLGVWRWMTLFIMTLNSSAWSFATAIAVGPSTSSAVMLVIATLAMAFALLPMLSWAIGLVLQMVVQLFCIGLFAMISGYTSGALLLPLGLWTALAFLALIAAIYARRVDMTKGDLHFMRLESSELQKQVDDTRSRLRETEQQRATLEAELSEILNLAEDANRAKTEFLATMSHEIRTPLNGILPILEMLHDTQLNNEQLKLVRTAQSSSRHLLRIINDILDFAKVESGKLQLETIEVDVRDLVRAIIELMSGSARNHNLKLSASVADDVPTVVRGDPIRLRQILINLVSNAIKFTEEGGIRVEVSRGHTSQKEVELLFAVADTGVGMTPETADRLFQSFTQADASTTRKHGGTGLGLVICKRLVELMGGRIGVRSALGQGSTFWFLVPLRKSVMEVPSARRDLNGVRILTLIQDKDVGARVSAHLRSWGVVEETSIDPSEALAKLHSTSMLGESWVFEAVLIDGNGIETRLPSLLTEIRSIEALRRVRIVVAVRSEKLAHRLKREFGVLVLTDSVRPEPLRRVLYRLFDVESRHFGNTDPGPEEIYDDLNVSTKEIELSAIQEAVSGGEFSGRVLLVEDNPVNLGVVQKALSKLGLRCVTAADGQQALCKFDEQRFEMIFMDCQMPVMDGYEATRAIRQIEKETDRVPTPIVAMTANGMAGDREKCFAAGMDDYLAKPINLDQLRSCVSGWLAASAKLVKQAETKTVPTVQAEIKEEAVLDESVLRELKEIMEDDYVDLLQTYLRNAPQLLAQVRAAITQGDVKAMLIPVHSLKSSSANVGAIELSELAKETEKLVRAGNFAEAERAFRAVDAGYRDVENALQQHVVRATTA